MARFIGWISAYKGNNSSEASRSSASMVRSTAHGWNVGGTVHVHASNTDDEKHGHRDQVRLEVDGGSTGSLVGYTVAWVTETDGLPALHIHLPNKYTKKHDFSSIVLIDDETNKETVIYTAPAAEGK